MVPITSKHTIDQWLRIQTLDDFAQVPLCDVCCICHEAFGTIPECAKDVGYIMPPPVVQFSRCKHFVHHGCMRAHLKIVYAGKRQENDARVAAVAANLLVPPHLISDDGILLMSAAATKELLPFSAPVNNYRFMIEAQCPMRCCLHASVYDDEYTTEVITTPPPLPQELPIEETPVLLLLPQSVSLRTATSSLLRTQTPLVSSSSSSSSVVISAPHYLSQKLIDRTRSPPSLSSPNDDVISAPHHLPERLLDHIALSSSTNDNPSNSTFMQCDEPRHDGLYDILASFESSSHDLREYYYRTKSSPQSRHPNAHPFAFP